MPERSDAPVVIALMMGELVYMKRLNRISCAIVDRAVRVRREHPGAPLVCESALMTAEAERLAGERSNVITALPQMRGHTTPLMAQWCARSAYAKRRLLLITHSLHAPRSVRVFRHYGLDATAIGIDLPFDRGDPDWKLRSAAIFRLYDAAAHIYCWIRGWI